ncbi:MAG: AraC family transcriptional regulator [Micropepsaceae bacterium]
MPRQRLRLGEHYATATLDRKIGPLRVWEFVHPPRCRIPEHRHERAHAIIVLSGGFAQFEEGDASQHREGDAILYPRGAAHANTIGADGARCLGIEFEADYLPQLMPLELARLGRRVKLGIRVNIDARRIKRAAAADDPDAPVEMERAVRDLMLKIVDTTEAEPTWISAIKTALSAQPSVNPDIRKLARVAGRHPAHVMREFRRHVGVSVGEYVRSLRVAHACHDLRRPKASLSEIAAAHGFADQSHFSRTFQRFMNMTPDEFRRASGSRFLDHASKTISSPT